MGYEAKIEPCRDIQKAERGEISAFLKQSPEDAEEWVLGMPEHAQSGLVFHRRLNFLLHAIWMEGSVIAAKGGIERILMGLDRSSQIQTNQDVIIGGITFAVSLYFGFKGIQSYRDERGKLNAASLKLTEKLRSAFPTNQTPTI